MQERDLAIPTLPTRSVSDAVAFYKRLGFIGGPHEFGNEYAILCLGEIEIHFFAHKELVPEQSSAGCYIRVLDVEKVYRDFSSLGLPPQGIPRIHSLENKPWGLREFAIVDPDGNLLRIGQVIEG
jgi:catechol 2,3-dioxygenase-like lactoylglutathione lyase family enzyme